VEAATSPSRWDVRRQRGTAQRTKKRDIEEKSVILEHKKRTVMITYRKAILSDTEKLAEIRSIFLKENNNVSSEEERIIFEQANLEYFRKTLCDNTFISWIALDDEVIIATSGLSFSVVPPFYPASDGKVAYIMNMYTFPNYRKQGIGTELFKRIVDEAKQLGYKKITLNATDMGKPLYEKYGFKDVQGDMNFFVQ
jgi:GNAT superfamily N-acetyltransferase